MMQDDRYLQDSDSKETMKDNPAVRMWLILPPVLRKGE